MRYFIFIIALFTSNFFYLHAKVNAYTAENGFLHSHQTNNRFLGDNEIASELDTLKKLDKTYLSKSGKFEFHYTLTGIDAIDATDKNNNNVPDYLDSAEYYIEYIYDIYVNQMGFLSPVQADNKENGSPYQIYMYEMGNYYSFTDDSNNTYTYYGGAYGQTILTEHIFPVKKYDRYYTVFHLDNNISKYDSAMSPDGKYKYPAYTATGIEGLKVTLAHEFHHAVQLMYGIDQPYSNAYYEMLSVLMEEYIFPNANDYVQYVDRLFDDLNDDRSKIGSFTNYAGYRQALFLMMLNQKYGIAFVKKSLELTLEGTSNFVALDLAIKELNPNSSLSQEWDAYKEWIYYAGNKKHKSPEDKTFTDAELFSELNFNEIVYEEPIIMHSETLNSMEINNFRIIFKKEGTVSDDTVDVMIGNISPTLLFKKLNNNLEYLFDISTTKQNQNMNFIDELSVYYEIDTPENISYNLFTYSGESTNSIGYSFPNPVNTNEQKDVFLPVPKNAMLYQEVNYVIYNTQMQNISHGRSNVIPYEGKRVIRIDGINDLNAGVYMFSVHYNNDNILGKMAVIRK